MEYCNKRDISVFKLLLQRIARCLLMLIVTLVLFQLDVYKHSNSLYFSAAIADDFGGGGTGGTGGSGGGGTAGGGPAGNNGDGTGNSNDGTGSFSFSGNGIDTNKSGSAGSGCRGLGGSSGAIGGPVSLISGNENFERTDIEVNGLFPIKLIRKYNNQSTFDSPLGYGWAFNYDRRLFEYPDPASTTGLSIVIRYDCGKQDRYVYTGGAYQTPVGGVLGQLEELAGGKYVFTHLSGIKDFYDAQGRLEAKENRQGHRLEFTYTNTKLPLTGSSPFSVDPSSSMVVAFHYQLLKIEERAADGALTGNSLTFTYDGNTGRLASVASGLDTPLITEDDKTITYQHDITGGLTIGNLTDVYGLEGYHSNYIYDDRDGNGAIQDYHNITVFKEGDTALPYINTYYSDDRVQTQAFGNTLRTFTYVIDGEETAVSKTVTDDKGLNPYQVDTYYWFDVATEKVYRFEDGMGNWFEYDYDANGFYDTARVYHNQGTKAAPNRILQKTIDYTYDAEGNKLFEIIALDDIGSGVETITKSWTYDNGWVSSEQVVSDEDISKIFRTEYTFYKDINNVPINIKEIKRRKDDGSFQVTTNTYDAQNKLSSIQFDDGHKKIFLYEGGSKYVTKIYHEIGGLESDFDKVRFAYDANGNISDLWDANNNNTYFEYDDKNRVTLIRNANLEETIYTYLNDRLEQIEKGKTAADGEGQITKYVYNTENRLEMIQKKNDSGVFITQISYAYDSDGRKISQTDGENNTTTYSYDNAGRLQAITDPLFKQTVYAYDAVGNRISQIDANLKETQTTYDDLDRKIKIDQLGVSPSITTTFTYDANSNLTSVIDGELKTTNYTYDALSNKKTESKQLGQTVQYFYDARNRLDYKINARLKKIDYGYYEWGPVKTIKYYADTTTTTVDRTVSYTYFNTGKIQDITDTDIQPTPSYGYTYDVLNRKDITSALFYPGSTITLDNDFNRFGNRSKLTLTDSSGVYAHQYNFNKLNQLSSAVLPGAQNFNNLTYYNDNKLKQITTPSGLTTDYLYEKNGPIKDIKISDGAAILEQLTYTYDNVLNVDTINDLAGLHDYGYDGVNRLTSVTHPLNIGLPTTESFTYDKAGNREDPADSLLYDYDNNNRITKSPGISSYTFDDDGSTLTRGASDVFTYNHDNRMVTFSDGTDNASYKYDPAGRRINKTVNGVTTWYLWDGNNLLAEYSDTGNQQKRYAYLPDRFAPIQMAIGSSIYDVHTDYLDTPRYLTGNTKNIVWKAYYESFGDASLAVELVDFNIRYPGQYFDVESGLHYNYFRDYDPSIGRYITSDPIGLAGGMNTYLYAEANSLRNIDPTGENIIIYIAAGGFILYTGYNIWTGAVDTFNSQVNSIDQAVQMQNDHTVQNVQDLQEEAFNNTVDTAHDLTNMAHIIEGGQIAGEINEVRHIIRSCQ